MANMLDNNASLATGHRLIGDAGTTLPLWPPMSQYATARGATEPVEVAYDYERVDRQLFAQPPLPGLERWAPLLPPLAPGLAMAEGGTALVPAPELAAWAGLDGELLVKDESRNPTWSHKDRFNLCSISVAVASGARGVVLASSGNHGASAAAYAARAGLPCIVLISRDTPPAVQSFIQAYGAAVLAVPPEGSRALIGQTVERLGYHFAHHAWGTEGYKTLAYEVFAQLGGRVPAAVLIPTSNAQLLYGVWKGFRELRELGVAASTPVMLACEPATRASHFQALEAGQERAEIVEGPTIAYAIGSHASSAQGMLALRESGGLAVPVPDEQTRAAQAALARRGIWQEASGAIGLAGLRQLVTTGRRFDGPVVCVACSSGFKDIGVGANPAPATALEWGSVCQALATHYGETQPALMEQIRPFLAHDS
jgi:threonine synthase